MSESRIPDLVRDSKLETRFHKSYTSHLYHEADPTSRQRTVARAEYWKRERRIGRGGFSTVWLGKCVKGQGEADVRAVKQFPKPARAKDYVRELEASAKFSHSRVCLRMRLLRCCYFIHLVCPLLRAVIRLVRRTGNSLVLLS